MKFVKRLFLFVLVTVLLVVLAGVLAFVRSRQQPDWYANAASYDPAQMEAAAREATQKLLSTSSWLSDRQAAETRAQAGDARPPLSAVPLSVFSVTFTEQELNAIFQRWTAQQGWEPLYSPYLSHPAIALRDGRLILAGTIKKLDRVASFHFRPTLDKEARQLRLDLESVMAGKLPMPQALFEGYRTDLSQKLAKELPRLQEGAALRRDGSVTDEAVAAAIGQLIMALLDREPVDATLLLARTDQRVVPVRIVDLAMEEDRVTLTVEMMSTDERAAWIRRLQQGPGESAVLTD